MTETSKNVFRSVVIFCLIDFIYSFNETHDRFDWYLDFFQPIHDGQDNRPECRTSSDCPLYSVCINGNCYPSVEYHELCVYDQQCSYNNAACNFLISRCSCHYGYKWKTRIRDCVPRDQCDDDAECLPTQMCHSTGVCVPKKLMTPIKTAIVSALLLILIAIVSIGVCCCTKSSKNPSDPTLQPLLISSPLINTD